MNTLKQKYTQEMENLQKENVVLREQYQKLQEDHETHLVSIAIIHRTHQAGTDEVEKTWREGISLITHNSKEQQMQRTDFIPLSMGSWKHNYHPDGRC